MSSSSTSRSGKTKKRVVPIAKDVDEVLKKCRRLRKELQRKGKGKNDNDNDNVPDTVPSDIVEVSELKETQVLEGMEAIALRIAQQVLAKKGFALDIPSRASSNQIYVKEWDRIVLGGKRSTRSFLNVKESRKSTITLRVLQLLHAGTDLWTVNCGYSYHYHLKESTFIFTQLTLYLLQSWSNAFTLQSGICFIPTSNYLSIKQNRMVFWMMSRP